MEITCNDCGRLYDDADRWTLCPHELLMPIEDLNRKKLALSLLEKPLRFKAGDLHAATPLRIESVSWNGYISFHGHADEYDPIFFEICESLP